MKFRLHEILSTIYDSLGGVTYMVCDTSQPSKIFFLHFLPNLKLHLFMVELIFLCWISSHYILKGLFLLISISSISLILDFIVGSRSSVVRDNFTLHMEDKIYFQLSLWASEGSWCWGRSECWQDSTVRVVFPAC